MYMIYSYTYLNMFWVYGRASQGVRAQRLCIIMSKSTNYRPIDLQHQPTYIYIYPFLVHLVGVLIGVLGVSHALGVLGVLGVPHHSRVGLHHWLLLSHHVRVGLIGISPLSRIPRKTLIVRHSTNFTPQIGNKTRVKNGKNMKFQTTGG